MVAAWPGFAPTEDEAALQVESCLVMMQLLPAGAEEQALQALACGLLPSRLSPVLRLGAASVREFGVSGGEMASFAAADGVLPAASVSTTGCTLRGQRCVIHGCLLQPAAPPNVCRVFSFVICQHRPKGGAAASAGGLCLLVARDDFRWAGQRPPQKPCGRCPDAACPAHRIEVPCPTRLDPLGGGR